MDLKQYIERVKDFPVKGVDFKDITPLLNNVDAFRYTIETMSEFVKKVNADVIVAAESRGFLFASAVAFHTGTRLVLVRKAGKLPRECHKVSYSLEYGENFQEMQKGDLKENDNVVIMDDVLATGGTIKAIIEMVKLEKANVSGISFLADLAYLHSDDLLSEYPVQKVLVYDN